MSLVVSNVMQTARHHQRFLWNALINSSDQQLHHPRLPSRSLRVASGSRQVASSFPELYETQVSIATRLGASCRRQPREFDR